MALKMTKGRDYQFELCIAGKKFMTGDTGSIGVLFNNFTGQNFNEKPDPHADHNDWLSYMAKEHETDLPLGAEVEMLTPEGIGLHKGHVGANLPST